MGCEGCRNEAAVLPLNTMLMRLVIMTISDSLVNPDEDTTAEERQNTFTDMMKSIPDLIAD